MRLIPLALLSGFIFFSLNACAETSALPAQAGYGAKPVLPEPQSNTIPTVNTATAIGWPPGAMPAAAQGLKVNAFAQGLDHPRWLYTLPNGDVLVAETDAPPKPEDSTGITGFIMKQVMKNAGSGRSKSANRITLLRDADGDGIAETTTVFLQNLNSPFGMALVGNTLYVANTDAVVKFPYQTGATEITAAGEKLTALPGGPLNHHWTKNIIASKDGSKLYATVGSNSNVAENGLDAEDERAAIWEINLTTGTHRIFASGLRNPNGLAWHPQSGQLWTAVNERDEIGNDLVPDYMTAVKDGGFYGWPFSYYGQHVDNRVKPQNPALVAKALMPDYALGAHTASLGLTFDDGKLLPAHYQNGAFIGQHGSWNRKPRNGYQVIFVPFKDGRPAGEPEPVLTDFLNAAGEAQGRPVGVAIDKQGALLVADDVGNTIWRVTPNLK